MCVSIALAPSDSAMARRAGSPSMKSTRSEPSARASAAAYRLIDGAPPPPATMSTGAPGSSRSPSATQRKASDSCRRRWPRLSPIRPPVTSSSWYRHRERGSNRMPLRPTRRICQIRKPISAAPWCRPPESLSCNGRIGRRRSGMRPRRGRRAKTRSLRRRSRLHPRRTHDRNKTRPAPETYP